MTDPISIISLSISICKSLCFFLAAWKNFNSDIAGSCQLIESLEKTLQVLETQHTSSNTIGSGLTHVHDCARDGHDGIMIMRERLNSIKVEKISPGTKLSAWLKLERTAYPLKKHRLIELQEIVVKVRDQMDLALQVIQMRNILHQNFSCFNNLLTLSEMH